MRFFLLTSFIALLSGCVSIEVKPEHIVSETVDAGKNLYRAVQAKSKDMEERQYSYVVANDVPQKDGETTDACFKKIKELANSASTQESSIYEQKSEITKIDGQRSVRCTAKALVKPIK